MILFQLDARTSDAAGETWGGFRRVGSPQPRELGGQKAVFFSGTGDSYERETPPELCGSRPRTIEVWAYKESVRGDEETLIAWGRRGGPAGTNLALNWGNSGAYGGVTHWAADLGWHGTPRAGQWHHLVYTYDGSVARLYDNGVEKSHIEVPLQTPPGFPIRIALQSDSAGRPALKNEFNGSPLSGPVGFALVRIHDVALSEIEIQKEFEQDRERFGATRPLTLKSLREAGTSTFTAGGLTLTLAKDGKPLGLVDTASGFDFLPTDRLLTRLGAGFSHLGDVLIRASEPVETITRWKAERDQLVLRATITNKNKTPVTLGAVGFPLVFNNIISDRTLPEAHERCTFADPYVGRDAGYVQVTRLTGGGPALVVIPDGRTPLEAYLPLREPTGSSQTFEGTYAWLAHSAAYARSEWKDATPWNPPTEATLPPGASVLYGLRFVLAQNIRDLEKTIAAAGVPTVVGIPGYIISEGSAAKLVLNHRSPLKNYDVTPAGALQLTSDGKTPGGGTSYALTAKGWGRTRLTLTYTDGKVQTVHYYLTRPAPKVVADLGNFQFTRQWFERPGDPFGRSPSVMGYDREANKIIEQESRVWIAGLGDEGGSGSWLAAGMKLLLQPDPAQLDKFERFIDGVLWGNLQLSSGPNKYGVKKSLFFYDPKELPGFSYDKNTNWGSWTSWNKRATEDIGRGYNYPHVVAVYWSLYRIARNHPGLVKRRDWRWHLEQAYQTTKFLFSGRVGYAELGLMEGTIFLELLRDLQREGWSVQAVALEAAFQKRALRWRQEAYPFGSEMAWDSTGQEEVYAWCRYFGFDDKADVTINSILGYTPTLPHWGYNGNARRYWDFLYGGKLPRIERQLHHYGSGLNALPLLSAFRASPTDTYLLRVGYGGMLGPLSNIDQEGFASAAFHSNPSTLKWDAYSGDYGPGFLGHALGVGCYLINDPALGWQAFGGKLTQKKNKVTVVPQDTLRQRVFLAPLGLYLTLDAGKFSQVTLDTSSKQVTITLDPGDTATPRAYLRVEGKHRPATPLATEREAFVIPLKTRPTQIELVP